MGLIIKCDPVHIDEDGRFTTTVKKYQEPVIKREGMAFVWESRAGEDSRLAYLAYIVEASDLEGGKVQLTCQVGSRRLERRLDLSSIRGLRGDAGTAPKSELARILYRHAHNKIATISASCADFLDAHFDAAPPVVLFHCINMVSYRGLEADIYAGGFKNPSDSGYGHEVFNFAEHQGRMYGHVQIMPREYKGKRKVVHPTLKIEKLGATKGAALVDGVLVVWTAPCRNGGGREIVGWYRDATIHRQSCLPTGSLGKARTVDLPNGKRDVCEYRVEAAARNCRLLKPEERDVILPNKKPGQKDMPGQMPVFYLSHRSTPALQKLEKRIRRVVDVQHIARPPASRRAPPAIRSPDLERRKKIEDTAVALVQTHFEQEWGYEIERVEAENRGYDLIARRGDLTLCIEVKGRSIQDVFAEFTINEYDKIILQQKQQFADGEYRICIVTDVLSEIEKPCIHHFSWSKAEREWRRVDGKTVLYLEERTAARASLFSRAGAMP